MWVLSHCFFFHLVEICLRLFLLKFVDTAHLPHKNLTHHSEKKIRTAIAVAPDAESAHDCIGNSAHLTNKPYEKCLKRPHLLLHPRRPTSPRLSGQAQGKNPPCAAQYDPRLVPPAVVYLKAAEPHNLDFKPRHEGYQTVVSVALARLIARSPFRRGKQPFVHAYHLVSRLLAIHHEKLKAARCQQREIFLHLPQRRHRPWPQHRFLGQHQPNEFFQLPRPIRQSQYSGQIIGLKLILNH